MSVLTISLPDDVREWLEGEAAASGASIDDFLSLLAREAKVRRQQRAAQEVELERLLLEGLDSGEPQAVDEQWWVTVRSEVDARLKEQSLSNGTRE
jgi:antitoxin ParD1/3/4